MRIAILGTGNVAQALAGALADAGHPVTLGSRTPADKADLPAPVTDLATAVDGAELVVNATWGTAVLDIVRQLGPSAFNGRIVLDVANQISPDLTLALPNDSLGRQLQEALPGARVVKTLNTVNYQVMADPGALATTTLFVSGNDPTAKKEVVGLLGELGWPSASVVDLGDITTARASEHYFYLFFALAKALGTRALNVQVVR